jgi:Ni,Fe-hydrogenase III component G
MTPLDQARQLLARRIQDWITPEENRLDAKVNPENLPEVVQLLAEGRWGYLIAITGLDNGTEAGTLEILYHFGCGAAVLTLRVTVPRDAAAVPSICGVIPYASVFERELSEMFGVHVRDTPDASRLYLPDDWQDGLFPLRKDAQLD